MQSDFHVHFSPEMAGILAHMANEKNTSIPTLIELLTTMVIEDAREEHILAKLADAVDMNQPRISHDELWAKLQTGVTIAQEFSRLRQGVTLGKTIPAQELSRFLQSCNPPSNAPVDIDALIGQAVLDNDRY